ncbi:MAG: 30S ribosomal protein S12 methylthiotransferase RimO [Treponema sp.]|jgi:ribosomal protein S12 methylthiotransferase|nr:30S ribosomal protein S12 methylthiotransferase RimO [Treponema sp.]
MKFFLDPFGCVKNQVDAENMMAFLVKTGWENASDAETADLIIVNSCGFIESAKQESINAVLEWRKLYPAKKILLAGCLSQRYAAELPQLLPEADAFMGVEDIAQIVEKAGKTLTYDSHELSRINNIISGERPLLSLPGSAYVKISEGCNNCCSYCAIPLIRGSLVSRKIPDIVEECRTLLKRGIVELNIIGQDIGAYGHGEEAKVSRLPELLNAISLLDGHFWVRLLYIHPNHFPLQILDLMESDKRFLPYFDVPFQHASEKILSAMNRAGSHEAYLTLLETIRARLPHAVIRSTFMLGFPGETEEDFAALLDFQQKANLDWLGCFAYSREEGTASYSMKGRIPQKTANKRKQTIEERQIPITEKNMEHFIGQTLDVLIEEQIADPVNAEESENLWLGRLYCQAPDIDGAAVVVSQNTEKLRVGSFAKCRVVTRRGFDLEVRVCL